MIRDQALMMHPPIVRTVVLLLPLGLLFLLGAPAAAETTFDTVSFLNEAKAFVGDEIGTHLRAVPSLDPPPPQVLGAATQGDFTWGSFMRAIAEARGLSGTTAIAGRDLAPFLGQLGRIEAKQGGKTFAQLGAAITLRSFGKDLETNALWKSLNDAERAEWRSLLDPGRFYDRKTKHVINLPENYLGVAARISALDWEMGILGDRALVDEVIDRAAGQFKDGALYTDDNLPTGRYDRYSQEYARFLYEAAQITGRKDVEDLVTPALHAVMRTWWDLASPDGYSYPWGRTIGAIGYMDTLDIVGFLARHPEFRPAPLADLVSVYHAAWEWLQHDYQRERHLLNMFGFGRGNYSYMSPERQWQQTTSFLAKAAGSLTLLEAAVRAEKVTAAPAAPRLPDVARFEWFRRGDRAAGVWLVRQGRLRFALPITTGTEPGMADYLPAPHGLPGFAPPVAQKVPALVPYLELADGRALVAGNGADTIEPRGDGRGMRALWRRWAVVPAAVTSAALVATAAPLEEPGLTADVTWSLEDGGGLLRRERIAASRPIDIRRLRLVFPSTGGLVTTRFETGKRIDRFRSSEAVLDVAVESATAPLEYSLEATGNSTLGKGARGPIPLLLHLQTGPLTLQAGDSFEWAIRLRMIGD
jgi:hypothetical protein